MASQHDSTTSQTWVSRPNIQSIQVKAQTEANMSEYRHLQMEKAKKPDYLPDPAGGTRS